MTPLLWRRRRWLVLLALGLATLAREVVFLVISVPRSSLAREAHPGILHAGGSSLSGSSLACVALFATGLVCQRSIRSTMRRHGQAKDAVQEALGADFFRQIVSPGAQKDSRLRPLIVAMGTRGDAEPGFRLAAALQERGHVPLVVSLDAYKNEAERLGLDFRSCGLDRVPLSEEYLTGRTRADQVYSDRGWYGEAWTMVGDRIYSAAMQHRCDVIVTTSMANTHCLDVAEKLDLLCFALKFCPDIDGQVPVGEFPPSGYPSLPGPVNYLQHVLENLRTVAAVFRGGYIPKVIEFRKNLGMESLEIPMVGAKVPTYSEMRQRLQANQPSFYAFSNSLTDRPSEYQPWHFITGSFSRASETSSELPGPLETFLEGEAPICVAFGSITLARGSPESFQGEAIAAARRCGKKVLVVDPQVEVEGPDKEDSEVFRIRSAPYSALFPRCCLVIHHGGAGTAQDCILAETPQLVAPVLRWSDQPFWANEVENRMLGLKIGEGGTPPSAEAWDLVYQRSFEKLQTFQRAAVKAKEEMAKEGGLETACQILEDVLSS